MSRNPFGIVFILIIIGLGWYVFTTPKTDGVTQATPAIGGTVPEMVVADSVTVTYSDSGYSPQAITVAEGETVTWVNESSKKMWVASAMHPTHTMYDGTSLKEHCASDATDSFDACQEVNQGETYSFTFEKAGEWKYHDHIDASKYGSVTVTPHAEGN